jgi:hypothetical protein
MLAKSLFAECKKLKTRQKSKFVECFGATLGKKIMFPSG